MPIECERLQGFPEGWTIPETLDVTDPDKVDTLRYNALGNAVTVAVAEWLARRIKTYLQTADQNKERPQEVALAAAFASSSR
jgi:DNA (cytosine-5)-methyltransferase 1